MKRISALACFGLAAAIAASCSTSDLVVKGDGSSKDGDGGEPMMMGEAGMPHNGTSGSSGTTATAGENAGGDKGLAGMSNGGASEGGANEGGASEGGNGAGGDDPTGTGGSAGTSGTAGTSGAAGTGGTAGDGGTAGGGGTAGMGGGGGVGGVMCPSACAGTTPVCINGVCSACRNGNDCASGTLSCLPSGACAQCSDTNKSACTGDTPVCLNEKCVQCEPEDGRCSTSVQPQKCSALGKWVNQTACSQPKPDCNSGGCLCTGVECNGSCTDTKKDVVNCGVCSHQCSTANATATRACTDGLCKPTCQPGYLDCNTPLGAAADNGCECAGTACCGSGCQTKHTTGVASVADFYSCHSESDSVTAMNACNAYIAQLANPAVYKCWDHSQELFALVCAHSTQSCGQPTGYCWGYGGSYIGNVYKANAATSGCSTNNPTCGTNGCVGDTPTASGTWH